MCGIITDNLQYMDLFPMVSAVFNSFYAEPENHSSVSAENKKKLPVRAASFKTKD